MSSLRITTINNAMAREGINATLVRGDGYFYFTGPDVEHAETPSVYVYRISHLSLDGWLDEARAFKRESAQRAVLLAN